MTNQSTIFRTNSLDRYLNRHEANIVPQFIRPQLSRYILILLVLLMSGAALLWFTTIPHYQTIEAKIARYQGKPVVAATLPQEIDPSLLERPVLIHRNDAKPLAKGRLLSKDEDTARFAISLLSDESFDLEENIGTPVEVKVQSGRQRLLFLLWP